MPKYSVVEVCKQCAIDSYGCRSSEGQLFVLDAQNAEDWSFIKPPRVKIIRQATSAEAKAWKEEGKRPQLEAAAKPEAAGK